MPIQCLSPKARVLQPLGPAELSDFELWTVICDILVSHPTSTSERVLPIICQVAEIASTHPHEYSNGMKRSTL